MTQHIPQHGAAGKPRAIETVYKNYKFRSRLEARWAVAFDKLGLAWTYEEEGFELPSGRYLPDFFFPDLDTYVEIKGRMPTEDDRDLARLTDLSVAKNCACFMFAGDPIDLLERPMRECYTWRIPAGHPLIANGHVINRLLEAANTYGVALPMTERGAYRTVFLNMGMALRVAQDLGWEHKPDGSDLGDIVAAALHSVPVDATDEWFAGVALFQEQLLEVFPQNDAHFKGVISAMRFVSHLSGQRMEAAAKAARQARFEFGAKP